ncbi:MAG TPA: HAD hydrolase-like protein [Candidatus Saccharimonadales bacterium]|jgi:phosphoglycolate phosphatase-like HAD superfamily hydrolase
MSKYLGNHIKAVIFDFDDTLVATIDAKWAHHKHVALKYYGRTLTDDDIRPHWGKPLTALVGLLYGEKDPEVGISRLMVANVDFPKLIQKDTLEVLKSIRNSGKLTGIVTAIATDKLAEDLGIAGIPKELFDYLQGENNTEYHKPDPRVFDPLKDWLTSKNVKPAETLYVGDGLHDMKAAIGAGLEFVGVTTGLVTQDEFAAHSIKSIPGLKELLLA